MTTDPWDARYDRPEYVYGTAPNDFLASVAERIPSGRVLSLADGEGRNGVFMAKRGLIVTAVDNSAVGLRKAAQLASASGVTLTTVHADLGTYTIEPEAWEAIVSIFVHLPAAVRHPLYQNVVRGLRPGGVFILEAYTPDQLAYGTGGPTDGARLAWLEELRTSLAGLRLEIARELVRVVREGTFHNGKSAVVQILGVKP